MSLPSASSLGAFPRRVLLTAAVGLAGVAASAAQEAAPQATGEVVRLPDFVVEETRELPAPEAWRYGRTAGWEILSELPDGPTQRLLRDFALFRLALVHLWPAADRPGPPTTLLLCRRGRTFAGFVPTADERGASTRASLHFQGPIRTALVLNVGAATVELPTAATEVADGAETDSTRLSVSPNAQLRRDYLRLIFRRDGARPPAWFEEGMTQVLLALRFDHRAITLGKLEERATVTAAAAQRAEIAEQLGPDDNGGGASPGEAVEERDFHIALQRRALVPLDRFFAVTAESPEAANPLGNNRWAKQAYAFAHLSLFGARGRFREPFERLARRAQREPVTEALFQEIFGLSYREMLLELRGHIDAPRYDYQGVRAEKGAALPQPPPVALRAATPAEIGRIKGEAFVLAGHPERGHAELIAPVVRRQPDAALLAALGLQEQAAGHDERARSWLETAVAARVERPEAYLELARYRAAAALAAPAGAGGRLDAAQTAAVLELLRIARAQPPPLAEVFELAADTLARSVVPPAEADLGFLMEGVQRFPGRLRLVYQTATLCSAGGWLAPAHSLAEHGIKLAAEPAIKARFERLKAALPPEPGETHP